MFTKKSSCFGIAILEFMLAMLISLLLLSILGMIYLAVEKNTAAQTAYRTIQENGRVATQLLVRNLHRAGRMGCARLTTDFPITNYLNYTLSPDNKILGTGTTLTIRSGGEASGAILQPMLTSSVLYASTDVHFSPGDMAIISDCQSAEIFKIKMLEKINPQTQKIISQMPLHKQYGNQSELHNFEINTYYVAATQRNSAGRVIYALYLKNYNNHKTELVEGIDAIHLTYDVIKDNQLVTLSADKIRDWSKVSGVRMMLGLSAIERYPLYKTAYGYAVVGESIT
jgi:hypothetical protein